MKWKRGALPAVLLSVTILLSLNGCTISAPDEALSSDTPSSSEEFTSDTSSILSSDETSSEKAPSEPESTVEKPAHTSSTAPSSKAENPVLPSLSSTEAPPESEAPAPPASEDSSDAPIDSAGITGRIEREILRLVNEERTNLGLGELSWNNLLYQSARIRSDEMAAHHQADNIEHVRPDGSQWYTAIQGAGYSYTRASENLLYIGVPPGANFDGSDVSTVAGEIFNGWKESPGHYENMIDAGVDEIGIAIAYDGTDIYATQHFGKR